ncbi:uncharacterized protein EAF01_008160 [Botrytis porri]|uniref:uncharacterized protein n=1 Tax=Botrytis porri TaxID=87229 RepID=UPI0019028084|nr:uncharacterized protein EAF01_008160 [Botrytis porri]KAF7898947.1 hypothetical protein EAF01_008160 [Botrytis porri]
MDSNSDDDKSTNPQHLVSITITHHGKPHIFSLPPTATITDLSDSISASLSIPPRNQKLMVSKLGLLKLPFKDPSLPITSLSDKKITLMGSTIAEASSVAAGALAASRIVNGPFTRPAPRVSAYKTCDWKREQEEAQYTFQTLRPLPYLPNPSKSLAFLQRLKDDAGIKAAMRKHKFTVPLLTEMNPIEHTVSNHEGTSRTLGLNRNQGEVIELRLRTDAYDGYRDYKTIRRTLCHELAHNVWGPHDRNFWNLCKEIEKEVEGNDWRSGGHVVGEEEYYSREEVDDHGGWRGGEFVLGVGGEGGAESTRGDLGQGLSRREILAKAAEERLRKVREQRGGEGGSAGEGSA